MRARDPNEGIASNTHSLKDKVKVRISKEEILMKNYSQFTEERKKKPLSELEARMIDEENRIRFETWYADSLKKQKKIDEEAEARYQKELAATKKREEIARAKRVVASARKRAITRKRQNAKALKFMRKEARAIRLTNNVKEFFKSEPEYILTRFGRADVEFSNLKRGEIVTLQLSTCSQDVIILDNKEHYVTAQTNDALFLITSKFIIMNRSMINIKGNEVSREWAELEYHRLEYASPRDYNLTFLEKIFTPNKGFYHLVTARDLEI